MKKISLVVLLCISVFILHAKENDGGFGVKGGIGLTTYGYEDEDATNQTNRMKLGGFASIGYEKQIGKVFALDIEAGYANKGFQNVQEYNVLGEKGKFITKFNLHTIELPISAKFYIGDNFNINVGPYAAFYIAGKMSGYKKPDGEKKELILEGQNLFEEDNNPEDADGDKLFNRHDIGANLGLEYVSDKGLGLGARFQKGFVDLTNKKYAIEDNKWVTNTGVQIYAIYRF